MLFNAPYDPYHFLDPFSQCLLSLCKLVTNVLLLTTPFYIYFVTASRGRKDSRLQLQLQRQLLSHIFAESF